ncbi:hypothetical protein CVT26_016199 [Gymnopilus dilepis]|uniref:Uncharacterized protein n=1 Tax=Gymnopilus dilepis TaxID=231916 RepID=A0A409XZ43_9AGAR|nr:hypothetical protein CVT26_016199 [Gymnopilus dilepis]
MSHFASGQLPSLIDLALAEEREFRTALRQALDGPGTWAREYKVIGNRLFNLLRTFDLLEVRGDFLMDHIGDLFEEALKLGYPPEFYEMREIMQRFDLDTPTGQSTSLVAGPFEVQASLRSTRETASSSTTSEVQASASASALRANNLPQASFHGASVLPASSSALTTEGLVNGNTFGDTVTHSLNSKMASLSVVNHARLPKEGGTKINEQRQSARFDAEVIGKGKDPQVAAGSQSNRKTTGEPNRMPVRLQTLHAASESVPGDVGNSDLEAEERAVHKVSPPEDDRRASKLPSIHGRGRSVPCFHVMDERLSGSPVKQTAKPSVYNVNNDNGIRSSISDNSDKGKDFIHFLRNSALLHMLSDVARCLKAIAQENHDLRKDVAELKERINVVLDKSEASNATLVKHMHEMVEGALHLAVEAAILAVGEGSTVHPVSQSQQANREQSGGPLSGSSGGAQTMSHMNNNGMAPFDALPTPPVSKKITVDVGVQHSMADVDVQYHSSIARVDVGTQHPFIMQGPIMLSTKAPSAASLLVGSGFQKPSGQFSYQHPLSPIPPASPASSLTTLPDQYNSDRERDHTPALHNTRGAAKRKGPILASMQQPSKRARMYKPIGRHLAQSTEGSWS